MPSKETNKEKDEQEEKGTQEKNEEKKKGTQEKNEEKKVDTGNVYDRMFKENGDSMFEPLLEMEAGLKLIEYQPLQEKIPKTLERELDFLYKITTETGEERLLHIEFQSENSNKMIYRMQEYNSLIYRKYKMLVDHFVFYLGASKQKMISELPKEAIFTGFNLICFNEIAPEKFLSIDRPEVVILALLGKYKKEQAEEILGLILDKLQQLPKYKEAPGRYINQLLLLSTFRKLDETITQKIKTMPIFTDAMIKDHVLYKEGKEDGIEQGREKEREALKAAAEKKEVQAIINFHTKGVEIKIIAESFNITQKRVKEVIDDWIKQSPKK